MEDDAPSHVLIVACRRDVRQPAREDALPYTVVVSVGRRGIALWHSRVRVDASKPLRERRLTHQRSQVCRDSHGIRHCLQQMRFSGANSGEGY